MKSIITPLYPPEGSPVSGFKCGICEDVTRTERGMHQHLLLCHGRRRLSQFTISGHPLSKSIRLNTRSKISVPLVFRQRCLAQISCASRFSSIACSRSKLYMALSSAVRDTGHAACWMCGYRRLWPMWLEDGRRIVGDARNHRRAARAGEDQTDNQGFHCRLQYPYTQRCEAWSSSAVPGLYQKVVRCGSWVSWITPSITAV